jgi:hypothetical protein
MGYSSRVVVVVVYLPIGENLLSFPYFPKINHFLTN